MGVKDYSAYITELIVILIWYGLQRLNISRMARGYLEPFLIFFMQYVRMDRAMSEIMAISSIVRMLDIIDTC